MEKRIRKLARLSLWVIIPVLLAIPVIGVALGTIGTLIYTAEREWTELEIMGAAFSVFLLTMGYSMLIIGSRLHG